MNLSDYRELPVRSDRHETFDRDESNGGEGRKEKTKWQVGRMVPGSGTGVEAAEALTSGRRDGVCVALSLACLKLL